MTTSARGYEGWCFAGNEVCHKSRRKDATPSRLLASSLLSGSRSSTSSRSRTLGAVGSLTAPIDLLAKSPIKDQKAIYIHELPAEEGDTDHEGPAGNLGESPDGPAERDVKTVLSERAVERVEEALVGCGLLVRLFNVDGGDLRSGDGGAVDVDGADGRGGSSLVGEWLRELHVEDLGRADTPGVAEDTVLVAVQVGEVGRVGSGGEEGDTAVEGRLRLFAHAEASGIAASHVDHPFLNTRAGSGRAGLDELLVVGKGQLRHLDVGDLCGGGIDGVWYRLDRGCGGNG